jgi:hypothetical protein
MNYEGFERKWSWPNLKALPWNFLGGIEESYDKPQSE